MGIGQTRFIFVLFLSVFLKIVKTIGLY